MAEVFLSYAREDAGRAKALAAALERTGRSVWWDRNIEGGTEYSIEIDDALKAAGAVIVLWSSHSIGSAWVRDEAAAGRDNNRLVPVRLDGADPPLGFRQFQTIDLSRWNGRDGPALKTLKSAVAAKVARSGKPSAEAAPLRAPGKTRPRWMLAALVATILAIAVAAYYWTSSRTDSAIPLIAIVPAPSGGDPALSDTLARSMSVELGILQAQATVRFQLRDPGGQTEDVDFLVEVAVAQSGAIATADLSLLASKGRQILWTSHLEKPNSREGLRLTAATRVAAVLDCLTEASGERLDQPILKLYLRGCEKFRDEFGGIADPSQLATLREVVDRAPRFAPAIAHLALIEANIERVDAARALIAKAKALDPNLAKIYLAESQLFPRFKWGQRQAILVEGLARNPNSAALNDAMAFELTQVGRRAEALQHSRRARELDPMSPVIRANFVQELVNSSRTAAGEKELIAAEAIWPASTTLLNARYAFDLRFGDPEKALRASHENGDTGATLGSTVGVPNPGPERFLVARIDPTPHNIDAVVKAYVDRFRKDPADVGSMVASLGFFGRVDPIFVALTNPVAVKSMALHSNTFFRPYMKPVLHHPRFMPLAARIGLVRYWTEADKWPDFCLDSDLPYDCKAKALGLKQASAVR